MQDSDFFLLQELYTNQLATLEGTNFTQREIDVMACLVHARGTSKIASILAVSSHTVVTHVRNIMSKLNCSSRENIIDFVERSKKSSLFKKYYACLVLLRDFEKSLTAISRLKEKKNSACLLICGNYQKYPKAFFQHLENHLKQAGLEVVIQKQDFAYTPMIPSNKILLFFVKTEDFEKASKNFADFESIELGGEINYYFSVFAILEKLFLDKTLDSIIAEFKKIYERVETPLEKPHSLALLSEKTGKHLWHQPLPFVKSKVTYGGLALLLVILVGIGFLYPSTHKSYIRSDLVFPTEAVLLDRSEIISRIDRGLKARSGIQTAALVGPGGAGKTTLARQYAHQQKANVIWEINAETHENLKSSFENLAQALSKTKEDKEILREIQETKDPLARENKILRFVKEHLKEASNWLLIFDNMEKFIDIQKYFPHDFKTWGQGKIIITTRDANIQNNRHINTTLQIGELDPSHKLLLFSKIMNSGGKEAFSNSEKKAAMAFLEKIPPYPLDISIAAYYLKSTHTSYSKYLDMLGAYSQDFAKVQENLLKEAGDYTKTRYGIITLSLQHLINTHPDFRDLLLIISFLDPQNIPIGLLDKYKGSATADNFIYNLKKNSFITSESLLSSGKMPTFSIHRSTQTIALAYLAQRQSSEKNNHFIEVVGMLFKNYVEEAIDKEDFFTMKLLIRHCEAFLSHHNLLPDFIVAAIGGELGNIYRDLSHYKKAKQYFEESLVLYKKSHFENHPWFARALAGLGNVHREQGSYKKAKQLFEASLSIFKKNSYENHPWFAQVLGCLGDIYREQCNYEKAKQLLEESLAIYRKNSHENHPWFARALAGLGV
jgi:DNA-binding CsgD family transcriptional regulator/ABC-type dipeptide/oligopeptide/nickel transport system ATPase subunit